MAIYSASIVAESLVPTDWNPHLLRPGYHRIDLTDWLDLEVERYEGEHQRLQVLNKIIEHAESLGVGGVCDVL
jgi:hypothetical protein